MADLLLAFFHFRLHSILGGGKSDAGCYTIATETKVEPQLQKKENDKRAVQEIVTKNSFRSTIADRENGCETVLSSNLILCSQNKH